MSQSVKDRLLAGAAVFDVRNPDEFAEGHFPGAVNIPLSEVEARVAEFGPKNRAIVLYCKSGRRSGIALDFLVQAGYTDCVNAGGFEDMPRL